MKIIGLILMISLTHVSNLWAKGQEGTGGDAVQAYFIGKGREVLRLLSESEAGQRKLKELNIDLERLENTLKARFVHSVDINLIDSYGKDVTALGKPGQILLERDAWLQYMEKKTDVRLLVLHEMFRCADYNDDDYVLTNQFEPLSQFFTEEEKYRLSNYIAISAIQARMMIGKRSFNLPLVAEVNDLSRTMEVVIPEQLVTLQRVARHDMGWSGENYLSVFIPLETRSGMKLGIRKMTVYFRGELSKASEFVVMQTIHAGFEAPKIYTHSKNAALPFNHEMRALHQEWNIIHYPEIWTEQDASIHYGPHMTLEGMDSDHYAVEKVTITFDFLERATEPKGK